MILRGVGWGRCRQTGEVLTFLRLYPWTHIAVHTSPGTFYRPLAHSLSSQGSHLDGMAVTPLSDVMMALESSVVGHSLAVQLWGSDVIMSLGTIFLSDYLNRVAVRIQHVLICKVLRTVLGTE